jgi:hypothetical protein
MLGVKYVDYIYKICCKCFDCKCVCFHHMNCRSGMCGFIMKTLICVNGNVDVVHRLLLKTNLHNGLSSGGKEKREIHCRGSFRRSAKCVQFVPVDCCSYRLSVLICFEVLEIKFFPD